MTNSPSYNDYSQAGILELFNKLEKIDLQLQYYYYQINIITNRKLDEFLLSEEEVNHRLKHPTGFPHWLENDSLYPLITNDEEEKSRIFLLMERFELTSFELEVILLGLLPYFDQRYNLFFSLLQNDAKKILPSIELALKILAPSWKEKSWYQNSFLAHSPLKLCHLLQIKPDIIWTQSQYLTVESIYHFLFGNKVLPEKLLHYANWKMLNHDNSYRTSSSARLEQALTETLLTYHDEHKPIVLLRGRFNSGREAFVARFMKDFAIPSLVLDIFHLPLDVKDALQLIEDIIREIRLHNACLIIKNYGQLADKNALLAGIAMLFNQPNLRIVCLLDGYAPIVKLKTLPFIQLEMYQLTKEERENLLSDHIPEETLNPSEIKILSNRFSFSHETMPTILQEAYLYRDIRDKNDKLNLNDLRKALQLQAQQNFGKLAQRITPKRKFADFIASPALLEQLKELLAAITWREKILEQGFSDKINYGTGISALFYGDSGTGKTMAAEVIAGSLGVDLIKVDLSTVVNKYIGETEKNLSRIFDLAEADSGVLFFDEADALFGKRSETKDSHDRHANIEISYLLQRLENYPGLVILATNNRSHLDSAFNRRFTFITRFTFPDAALREAMWQAIWPHNIKVSEEINFSELAKKADITGANIRNIALLASLIAAENNCEIIQKDHIEKAMKRELAKVGRLLI